MTWTTEGRPLMDLPTVESVLAAFVGDLDTRWPTALDAAAAIAGARRRRREARKLMGDTVEISQAIGARRWLSADVELALAKRAFNDCVDAALRPSWRRDIRCHTESLGNVVSRLAGAWLDGRPEPLTRLKSGYECYAGALMRGEVGHFPDD